MLDMLHLACRHSTREECQGLSTEPEVEVPKNLPTGHLEVVTQIVPTTKLVVKLISPLIPSDQAEEERQYILVVTASVRRLNLEATGAILGDMVTALAGGVAFKNPQMVAVLPGPTRGGGWLPTWVPP